MQIGLNTYLTSLFICSSIYTQSDVLKRLSTKVYCPCEVQAQSVKDKENDDADNHRRSYARLDDGAAGGCRARRDMTSGR